ncbi:MAG: energy-coupling factor transporter transmembrane component T [Chloroflexi bacterium]|nr:energy-coupling factor transporter transmembrane component T [Chloroflexota bacterium]
MISGLEKSGLRQIDARVKILWFLATTLAGLIFVEPWPLLLLLASIIVVAVLGGVLGETLRRLRSLVLLIIVFGLIFGLTAPGRPLFYLVPHLGSIGPALPFTQEGLALGIVAILRIFVFSIPILIVIMTTNNSDLIQGLIVFRLPLEFALMIVLALNFVPIALNEFGRIADAQKARGHSLLEKGLIGKARGLVPIFIPLTLNAIDRADTVGKVLEMRGFARRQFRPEFAPLQLSSWVLLWFVVALLGLTLATVLYRLFS